MVNLTEFQHCCADRGEPLRRTTISAALHLSGLYSRGARQSPLLSKRHKTMHLEFVKQAAEIFLVHGKTKFSETKIETKIDMFGLNDKHRSGGIHTSLITWPTQSIERSMVVVAASSSGAAETGRLVRAEERQQCTETSLLITCSATLWTLWKTFFFHQDNPKHTAKITKQQL